ncbi:MAG: Bug family tripartite tricarboxylate transporter substrate binding protein [Beijerinckiaceae bacterium]
MRIQRLAVASLLTGFALTTGAGAQESVASFYKGRNLNILVGSAPGGGYDLYARHVARHMGKHIPGNPDMVVQNMPGAGGLIAANTLFNRSPRDGSTIGHIQGPLSIRQIAGARNVQYDMRKFGWLGSANHTSNVCVMSPRVDVKTAKDLLTREVIIGGSGGSTTYIPSFLNAVAGTKFKIIAGYKSTNDVVIAIERGEVEGLCGWGWDSAKGNARSFFDRGVLRVGLDVGGQPHPELSKQGVPFVMDLVSDPKNESILRFAFSYLVYIRPFVTPPDLPPDRLKALQDAFAQTFKDPEFLAEAEKSDLEVRYISPAEVMKALDAAFNAPEDVRNNAMAKLKEAGFEGL